MMEQAQEVLEPAKLHEYLISVGILGGAVFGAAEGMGAIIKLRAKIKRPYKLWISMVLGPAVAMVAYGAGFLPTPPEAGPWGWAFAAIMGLVGSFMSKGAADVIKKVKK